MKSLCKIVLTGVLLLSAVSLSSCATTKGQPKLSKVYITNTKSVRLLEPQNMAGSFDDLVYFTAKFGDQEMSFASLFQADETGINLNLLNEFATDMGSLYYDGSQIIVDSNVLPADFKAEYIVFDLQLAFYEINPLSLSLHNSGITFSCEQYPDKEIRNVYDGKKLICQITKLGNKVTIVNKLRNYSYTILFPNLVIQ